MRKIIASPYKYPIGKPMRVQDDITEPARFNAFIQKHILPGEKTVSVFGSSSTKPGDLVYEQTRILFRMLAEQGLVTINGAYYGQLEAAAVGAQSAGGKVLGLDVIVKGWPAAKLTIPEEYTFRFQTYPARTFGLLLSDFLVFTDGGIGTQGELFDTSALLFSQEYQPRPIILFGPGNYWEEWRSWMDTSIISRGYIKKEYNIYQYFTFCKTPEEALNKILELKME